ncbi:pectin lyase fold/virulence factor [Pseudomassariella vexata]|uniref:Pectin lyase fold/virulence factor n=1 Tax=Pseudomassariella vexata TaxID=1141098 RepID=A0A1Y2DZ60_9PEZI|nr:pectin lyase fold/virulence factor [Pseudomassariella vexata]ORY64517.1 pectin lyase fold/virulence factor [Pseudomassariella vexata]
MKTTTALFALGLSVMTKASPVLRRANASEAASVVMPPKTAVPPAEAAAICIVDGTIEGAEAVQVTSDTTILGKDSNAILKGVGLKINGKSGKPVTNVIVRNLSIDKVLATTGDAIGMQFVENVWVDHCDLQGDRTQSDKDKYDGLFDVTHGSDYVTITNSFLHNHWKGSLIGHSDNNGEKTPDT